MSIVISVYYDIMNTDRDTEHHFRKEINKMYEVVKVVKGYEITRMKGSKGCYHVNVREGKGFREFHTFKTIKAATEFIQKAL